MKETGVNLRSTLRSEGGPRASRLQTKLATRKKPKRRVWNDRFVLEKIPDYDALWDKHCASFISTVIKGRPRIGFEGKGTILFSPGGIRQGRPITAEPKIRDTPLFGETLPKPKKKTLDSPPKDQMKSTIRKQEESKRNQTISALIEELKYLFEENKIDQYYRKAYLEGVKKLNNHFLIQFIAREIDNMYNEKSHIQALTTNMAKREAAIRAVHEMISRIQQNPDFNENPEIRAQMARMLDRLRLASLSVIEQAQQYRLQLAEIYQAARIPDFAEKATKFYIDYSGINYLVKMKTDLDFLASSEFTKKISKTNTQQKLLNAILSKYIRKKVYDLSDVTDQLLLNVRFKPRYITRKAGKRAKKGSKQARLCEKRAEEMGIPTALYKRIREANIILRNEADTQETKIKPKENEHDDIIDNEIIGLLEENCIEEEKGLDAIPEEADYALERLLEEHLEKVIEIYPSKLPKHLLESQTEFKILKEEATKFSEVLWLQYSPTAGAGSKSKQKGNAEDIEGLTLIGKSEDFVSVILHFSTIHEKNLGNLLKQVIKYISRAHNPKKIKCYLKKIQYEDTTKFSEKLINALKIENNFVQSEIDETCFELPINSPEENNVPFEEKKVKDDEKVEDSLKLEKTKETPQDKSNTPIIDEKREGNILTPEESIESPKKEQSAQSDKSPEVDTPKIDEKREGNISTPEEKDNPNEIDNNKEGNTSKPEDANGPKEAFEAPTKRKSTKLEKSHEDNAPQHKQIETTPKIENLKEVASPKPNDSPQETPEALEEKISTTLKPNSSESGSRLPESNLVLN